MYRTKTVYGRFTHFCNTVGTDIKKLAQLNTNAKQSKQIS